MSSEIAKIRWADGVRRSGNQQGGSRQRECVVTLMRFKLLRQEKANQMSKGGEVEQFHE